MNNLIADYISSYSIYIYFLNNVVKNLFFKKWENKSDNRLLLDYQIVTSKINRQSIGCRKINRMLNNI